MLIVSLFLFGLAVLFLALGIDLWVGGLAGAAVGGLRRWRRPVVQNAGGSGDGWGTALGLVVALLVLFLAWNYYIF